MIHVVSFNIDSTKTAGQTQVIAHGASFTPQVILFWMSGPTSAVDVVEAGNAVFSFGFSSGSANRVVAGYSGDGRVTSAAARAGFSDGCICALSRSGGVTSIVGRASATFDATDITLTMVVQFNANYRVTALLVGGGEITNIGIGTATAPIAPGNVDVTTGFTVTDGNGALVLLSASRPTDNSTGASLQLSVGTMTGSSNQACWSAFSQDAQGFAVTKRYVFSGESLAHPNATGVETRVQSSWIANGFRLNFVEQINNAFLVYYLAIKGGSWNTLTFSTPTDTVTDLILTPGFQTSGGLVVSGTSSQSANDTTQDNSILSCGAFASAQHAQFFFDQHNADTTNIRRGLNHSNCFMRISSGGTLQATMQKTAITQTQAIFRMTQTDGVSDFGWMLLQGNIVGGGDGLTLLSTRPFW